MGYVRDTVYRLHFEQPDLEGLEVKVRSMPVGDYLELMQRRRAFGAMPIGTERDAMLIGLYESFAPYLVSWNVEILDEDGNSSIVPPTVQGLLSQDNEFVLAIMLAWYEIIAGVPIPLAKPSTDGGSSVEGSLTMVPLSVSQAS